MNVASKKSDHFEKRHIKSTERDAIIRPPHGISPKEPAIQFGLLVFLYIVAY